MSQTEIDLASVAAFLAENCDPRYHTAETLAAALTADDLRLIAVPADGGVAFALVYALTHCNGGVDLDVVAMNGIDGRDWTKEMLPTVRRIAQAEGAQRITAECQRTGMVKLLENDGFKVSSTLMVAEV